VAGQRCCDRCRRQAAPRPGRGAVAPALPPAAPSRRASPPPLGSTRRRARAGCVRVPRWAPGQAWRCAPSCTVGGLLPSGREWWEEIVCALSATGCNRMMAAFLVGLRTLLAHRVAKRSRASRAGLA
jgi:hypothetical protein